MLAAQSHSRAQAVVGVGRRHPDVHYRDVRVVRLDGGAERVGVADRRGDLVPAVLEDLGEPGSKYRGVLGDHYSHAACSQVPDGISMVTTVGPRGGC